VTSRERGPLELGLYPACGFRLLLRPHHPPRTDRKPLTAMNLDPIVPMDRAVRTDRFAMSIAEVGAWTHLADDYGLWNDAAHRRAAIDALAQPGDLFTFLLPDPDMSYALRCTEAGFACDCGSWIRRISPIRPCGSTRVWRSRASPRSGGASRCR
jgi:hypothetical protein